MKKLLLAFIFLAGCVKLTPAVGPHNIQEIDFIFCYELMGVKFYRTQDAICRSKRFVQKDLEWFVDDIKNFVDDPVPLFPKHVFYVREIVVNGGWYPGYYHASKDIVVIEAFSRNKLLSHEFWHSIGEKSGVLPHEDSCHRHETWKIVDPKFVERRSMCWN